MIVLALAQDLKDTALATGAVSIASKIDGWWWPILGGLLGVLAHLRMKWGDKRRFDKDLSLWAYVSDPRRTRAHVLTLLVIGVWVYDVRIADIGLRRWVPFHPFSGFMLGFFSDFVVKYVAKRVPAFGQLIGARRDSGGDMTIGPTQQMPAVPPPPGFEPPPRDSSS